MFHIIETLLTRGMGTFKHDESLNWANRRVKRVSLQGNESLDSSTMSEMVSIPFIVKV